MDTDICTTFQASISSVALKKEDGEMAHPRTLYSEGGSDT